MRNRWFVGLTAVGFSLLVACGGNKPVEINPDAQTMSTRWNAVLSTPAELVGVTEIRGEGWAARDPKDEGKTLAHVSISNAVPNAVHPWHVHRGECGSDQGIAGPADAYPALKVDGDGRAEASAELAVTMPRSGKYFINVHASPKNMSRIVSCGNLAPPAQ